MYVGKAEDDLIRTAQHIMCYQHADSSDEDLNSLYRYCKATDTVFHFALVSFEEDNEAHKSLGEALWCSILGTYQLKADYLAIRRDYGLSNVGEGVIGTNSTTCTHRPTRWASVAPEKTGILDRRVLALKRQLCVAADRWTLALLKGDDTRAGNCKTQMLLLQEARRTRAASLLLSGTLLYRPCSSQVQFCLGAVLDKGFPDALPEGVWAVRLREDAGSWSIMGAVEEEIHLFAGVALEFKGEGSGNVWRVYQRVGGYRGNQPRRFAFRLLGYLPAPSQQARRDQSSAMEFTCHQRRPSHSEQLSTAAKAAFDGQFHLSTSIRLYNNRSSRGSSHPGIKLTGQSQMQLAAAKSQLRSALGVQDDTSVLVPVRFRLINGGESSFTPSAYRDANPRHHIEILTYQGVWIQMPFKILPKSGTKDHPTNQLVESFQELEPQQAVPLQLPGLFAPKQRSIQRASALGQANVNIWARPAMRQAATWYT
ncbi:unnamed protein product [Sympodiomycopsis kandeliae]